MVRAKVPDVPGFPDSVAVPLPLSTKVTPPGRVPDLVIVGGAGKPVVWTVNEPAVPTVKVTPAALVIAGAWSTVSVKGWVAFGSVPFDAVIVSEYVPPVFDPGVPPSVAVPLPLLVNVIPAGRLAVSETAAAGKPVVETVKLAATPTVTVTLEGVVMAGAWLTLTSVLALSLPTHSDSFGVTV